MEIYLAKITMQTDKVPQTCQEYAFISYVVQTLLTSVQNKISQDLVLKIKTYKLRESENKYICVP